MTFVDLRRLAALTRGGGQCKALTQVRTKFGVRRLVAAFLFVAYYSRERNAVTGHRTGHSRAAKRQKNFSLARKRQVNCHRVFKPGTGGRYP
jgi:hypothetical protein